MKKFALAPCNGMSPNGLVARVAVGDCGKECENVISICMGSTSADIGGKNDALLKKQDIIAINAAAIIVSMQFWKTEELEWPKQLMLAKC